MALDLRLQHKMTQQLVMTPQLQQAIKLLALSHLEMAQVLRDEIEQNPVLEEHDPYSGSDEADIDPLHQDHAPFAAGDGDAGGMELESEPALLDAEGQLGQAQDAQQNGSDVATELLGDGDRLDADLASDAEADPDATPVPDNAQISSDIDWDNYLDAHSYALPGSGHSASDGAAAPSEAQQPKPTSLIEHLRWQLQMSGLLPHQQRIAWLLTEEINPDGYLNPGAVALVADELDCSQVDVTQVLHTLQEFDPKGVGARDLAECLALQARHLSGAHPLVHAIIEKFLPLLQKRDMQSIARALKTSVSEVIEAVCVIRHLEPRPGSAFFDTEPQYIIPDIYVHKIGPGTADYEVTLNEDGLPRLQISQVYRGGAGSQMHGADKQYLQEKYRSAAWLIRSIHMRQRTIYRVMQSILKFQLDFFEHGVQALKPLVLRDVAEDVDMHESTISRVTTNKYVHTPQGIYELKYFFNSSIRGADGDNLASESVRCHIERLIASEDAAAPHSDQQIVQILKVQDIDIARRTVAKYREMLKIPSSSRRRRVF